MVDVERVRAIGNWAFLKVIPREENRSGIIRPESQADAVGYCKARVLSLGSGEYLPKVGRRVREKNVNPGDMVFVRKYLTEVNPVDSIGQFDFCFVDQYDLYAEIDEDLKIDVIRI